MSEDKIKFLLNGYRHKIDKLQKPLDPKMYGRLRKQSVQARLHDEHNV